MWGLQILFLAYGTVCCKDKVQSANCARTMMYEIQRFKDSTQSCIYCDIYERKAPITDTQTAVGCDTLEQQCLKSVFTMLLLWAIRLSIILWHNVPVPSTQLNLNTTGTRVNRKKFHQIYDGTNYYKFSFFTML